MPIAGLISGFQGRREEEIKRQQQEDASRRQGESKVFEYLLQSNDPEMRALALSGLLESARPGKKGKGFAGYMGEIQGGEFYPQILARMNEEVPDEGPSGGGAPPTGGLGSIPAVPGSAAMPANQPVRPGSTPIGLPATPAGPEPLPPPADLGSELSGQGTAGMMGGAPPAPFPQGVPSKWKRRGTGVPTAEEIAEANAAAGIRGRMTAMTQGLQQVGAPPPMIQRALLGIAGAPPPADRMMAGDQVVLPDGSGPHDTLWVNGIQQLPDGRPVPPGSKVVKVGGGNAGQKTAKMPDPSSPTGWVKVVYDAAGQEVYRMPDTPFVPPPAFAGTGTFDDPTQPGVSVRAGIPRGGGAPVPLGDEPSAVDPQTQKDAEALIAIVDRRIADSRRPGLPVRPGQRDTITAEEARRMNQPYTTYAEVVQAAKATPPITKREQAGGGSIAERVRARALENRRTKAGAPPPVR